MTIAFILMYLSGSHLSGLIWVLLPPAIRPNILIVHSVVKLSIVIIGFRLVTKTFLIPTDPSVQNEFIQALSGIGIGFVYFYIESVIKSRQEIRFALTKEQILPLIAVIIIAISEEILYRHLLIQLTSSAPLPKVAIFLVFSFFFGLEHSHMGQHEILFKTVFCTSLYFAYFVFSSFLVPLMIHISFNIFSMTQKHILNYIDPIFMSVRNLLGFLLLTSSFWILYHSFRLFPDVSIIFITGLTLNTIIQSFYILFERYNILMNHLIPEIVILFLFYMLMTMSDIEPSLRLFIISSYLAWRALIYQLLKRCKTSQTQFHESNCHG